jgi:hypothetical protein
MQLSSPRSLAIVIRTFFCRIPRLRGLPDIADDLLSFLEGPFYWRGRETVLNANRRCHLEISK